MSRAEGSEGTVVGAQVYKGNAVEAHDTIYAIMSLYDTQGAAGATNITLGDAKAREC